MNFGNINVVGGSFVTLEVRESSKLTVLYKYENHYPLKQLVIRHDAFTNVTFNHNKLTLIYMGKRGHADAPCFF